MIFYLFLISFILMIFYLFLIFMLLKTVLPFTKPPRVMLLCYLILCSNSLVKFFKYKNI